MIFRTKSNLARVRLAGLKTKSTNGLLIESNVVELCKINLLRQLEGFIMNLRLKRDPRDDIFNGRYGSIASCLNQRDNKKIREAYDQFLEKYGPYLWFVTLTFRNQDCDVVYAEERLSELSKRVDNVAYGHASKPPREYTINFVAVLEKNSSDGYHWHLLINAPKYEPLKIPKMLIPDVLINIWKSLDGTGSNNDVRYFDASIHLDYISKQMRLRDDCIYFKWM
jgi:hypothetical protein